MRNRLFIKTFLLVILIFECTRGIAQFSNPCNECIGSGTYGGGPACQSAQLSGYHVPVHNNSSWELIFEENFNTPMTDQGDYVLFNEAWNCAYHWADHVSDLTCTTRDNLIFDQNLGQDGAVNIQTQHEPGTYCDTYEGPDYKDYTVANLLVYDPQENRNRSFGPGKFEIRCIIPEIDAQWPAFWLYENDPEEDPHGQEIDVFEIKQDPLYQNDCSIDPNCDDPEFATINQAGKRMIMTSHYYFDSPPSGQVIDQCGPQMCYVHDQPLSNTWHTYTLIWDEDYIQWLFDGTPIYTRYRFQHLVNQNITVKDVTFPSPKIDMDLRVSTSIWSEYVVKTIEDYALVCAEPSLPNDFIVDYVRVWKRQCGSGWRTLCFDSDPFVFYDPNDAIVRAQMINMSPTCSPWVVSSGQKLKLGAIDEIELVNFEAHLGSDFVATIENCGELAYRSVNSASPPLSPTGNFISAKKVSDKKTMVFPNPSNGEFTVTIQSSYIITTNMNIRDMAGRVLSNQIISLQEGSNSILISKVDLSEGIYFIQIDGFDEPIKIIIAK